MGKTLKRPAAKKAKPNGSPKKRPAARDPQEQEPSTPKPKYSLYQIALSRQIGLSPDDIDWRQPIIGADFNVPNSADARGAGPDGCD